MKRVGAVSVGDVLRQTLEESDLDSRLAELKAVAVWPRVAGSHIASLCAKPYIASGVMTVGVLSAPLRHELNMNRSALADAINGAIGRKVVSEMRFTAPRPDIK